MITQVIKVNRAPVLTLWAVVVAERLGHPADLALTLAHAVAGSSARAKARSIGIAEVRDQTAEKRDAELRPSFKPVRLLGRDIRLAATTPANCWPRTRASRAIQLQSGVIW